MCGICGIIYFDNKAADLAKSLLRINDTLKHRGPDDEGYLLISNNSSGTFKGDDTRYQSELADQVDYYPKEHISKAFDKKWSVGFGFRRLSIFDLTIRGHQPMSYLDRYWIIFNGEIYNYIEIREELQRNNYHFKSDTDTEVVLAAYDKWGKDCLHKFNGMWAMVIYNRVENKIFISRDRFGIKPLVYYIDDEKLIFASEIKALLNSGLITTTPHLSYVNDFLKSDGKEYISETSFHNIYRFPHGCCYESSMKIISKDHFNPSRYYDLSYNVSVESYNEDKARILAQEYLEILEDSIRLRLRADVPVGTCLSGGMDSTSIAWFINKILRESNAYLQQRTFSLIFDKDERTKYTDESKFIKELVELLKVNSWFISPSSSDIKSMYRKMIYSMDNPQVSSLMSYMFTYKLVKEGGVTVTLDGQGADEQQVGYIPYLMNHFSNLSFNNIIENAGLYNSNTEYIKNVNLGILFKIIGKAGLGSIARMTLFLVGKYTDPFISVNERLYNDINGNLINLFHYGDRASMAFSIESRLPMMDYRMVEFWMNMPVCYKIHNGFTKYVARIAMIEKLPESITSRKDKMGWEIPQRVWFRQDLKEWFDSNIVNSIFLPDFLKIKKKKLESMVSKNDLSYGELKHLIKLHNLALWYQTFFENIPVVQ